MEIQITKDDFREFLDRISDETRYVFERVNNICMDQNEKLRKELFKNKSVSFVYDKGKIEYVKDVKMIAYMEVGGYTYNDTKTILSPRAVKKMIPIHNVQTHQLAEDLKDHKLIMKNLKKLRLNYNGIPISFELLLKEQINIFSDEGRQLNINCGDFKPSEKTYWALEGYDILIIENPEYYQNILDILYKCEQRSKHSKELFNEDGNLLDVYKNRTLEDIDLSEVNFDDKNIAGINISKNIVYINFDKIRKDLSNTVLKGYDSQGYILRRFDLTNANLEDTSFGVDLATCNVSIPSKMENGTQFDEKNKFYFGTQELEKEQVKKLGINIYKRR